MKAQQHQPARQIKAARPRKAAAWSRNSLRGWREERRQAEALRAIVTATAGSGQAFFQGLVAELAKILGFKYAFVGRLLPGAPERVRTVAVWAEGVGTAPFEYELEGTPCADVVGKRFCLYARGVQQRFPRDKMLAELRAESYLGIPLFGANGAALGVLCVMDDRPMADSELAESLMTVFAARAAAELERQEALEALRESEGRYRTLHEANPTMIFTLDAQGTILSANPFAARQLGYSREELEGQPMFNLVHPEDRLAMGEQLGHCLQHPQQVGHWQFRKLRKDGGLLWVEEIAQTLSGAEGGRNVLVVCQDVTERKRAEEALRRAHDELEQRVRERTAELVGANEHLAELDRLKSQFLATMSHELRTPLNSILGFTGILRQGFAGPVNAEQKKQLDLAYGSARHLLSMINDLLDLSRIEADKVTIERQPFNFAEVVTEVVEILEPLARQKNLRLASELSGPVLELVGDRKRCLQVLLNLANNAVKFTRQGEVRITARLEPALLRVSVADTGIGIKPEQMGMLFEAFRQLDSSAKRLYEGTGLGLHLCRRLLRLMGGEIRAESEYGKGSCFSFTLPRRPPDPDQPAAPAKEGHDENSDRR